MSDPIFFVTRAVLEYIVPQPGSRKMSAELHATAEGLLTPSTYGLLVRGEGKNRGMLIPWPHVLRLDVTFGERGVVKPLEAPGALTPLPKDYFPNPPSSHRKRKR